MADIVKMFTSGFWRYVVAWLLPCAAFLGGLLATIYPSAKHLPVLTQIDKAATADTTLGLVIFSGVTLGLSAVLALSYEPVYRLWEGYTWPKKLFMFGRKMELKRYESLQKRRNSYVDLEEETENAENLKDEEKDNLTAYYETKRSLLGELKQQFPEYGQDFLPTRLGNGLRAAERYGYERFGLDSQALWYEVGAAAPQELAEELNAARGVVDFFISAATLSSAFVLVSIGAALAKLDWSFVWYALIALVISRLCYLRAARSVGAIARAQQAIVNVSREELANQFGLTIPDEFEQEQEMWKALKRFVVDGKADDLQEWRQLAPPDQAEPAGENTLSQRHPATSLPARRRMAR